MALGIASPKEHYVADACVIWCFDDRFTGLYNWFINDRGFQHVDLIKIAGGGKALATAGPDRDFVLNQVKISVSLHNARRVTAMWHKDCGAYGGSKAFVDAADEMRKLSSDAAEGKKFLFAEIPNIAMECVLADFDGLHPLS